MSIFATHSVISINSASTYHSFRAIKQISASFKGMPQITSSVWWDLSSIFISASTLAISPSSSMSPCMIIYASFSVTQISWSKIKEFSSTSPSAPISSSRTPQSSLLAYPGPTIHPFRPSFYSIFSASFLTFTNFFD